MIDGTGKPVAVTVKVHATLVAQVVLATLVITGAWFTVSVKFWVSCGLMPFFATNLKERTPPEPGAGVPESVRRYCHYSTYRSYGTIGGSN